MGKKTIWTFVILTLLLLAALFGAMAFGSVVLPFQRMLNAFQGSDHVAEVILFELRLPRMLGAGLAGAGLAVAGLLLQTVTDNDLCSPNIIGVNAGAGLCVMIVLCVAPALWRLLPLAAFFGALATTLVVLSVSYLGRDYEHKSTLVLAGVAVSALLNAGISFLSLKYPDVLSSYAAFSVGGFSGVTMKQLPIPAGIIAVGFLAAWIMAPKIGLLCLGDEMAETLGIRVRAMRMAAVVVASALCAAVVSFAGLLGFAGLIVPHIVRRLTGAGLRTNLPLAALCGMVVVIFSDLLGRILFAPWELPAGIIMAFVGAPFFIYLVIRRRKRYA